MTTQLLADRLRGLEGSPTLALAAKAKELQKAGKPVLDFSAGEPDFPTPEPIKEAAIQAIKENRTKYTPVAGIPELRQAIANNLSRRLGVPYAPAEVMVSCGAKHVLYNALQVLCEPGDEVLILSPYWVSYPPLVQLAGAKPVIVETREENRYQPDPESVEAAVTTKTKAIILNSPANPTGMLVDRNRLVELTRIVLKHQLFVLTDEIYDQMIFPPEQPCSIVQVDRKIIEWAILVNGVSKSYSMTGWRIGYAAGPKHVIDAMSTLQSHSTSNPTSISQYAALQAIAGDQKAVGVMVREFQRRRDRLVRGLNRFPGLSCLTPQGAFYAWCNVSQLKQPAATVAARWLEDLFLVAVPGEGFGSSHHLRFSFATSLESIDEGLARMGQWLEQTRQ